LVRDNPNKTELQVSHTVVVPLANHDLVSRQAQSAIFGCWKDQQINLSTRKSATPMPRRNNFRRDNFSIATALVSVLQRLPWRRSRLPSRPGACGDDNKRNGQRNP
jgi:hypothetical protein